MITKILLSIVVTIPSLLVYGQISPPGLGRANTASWIALGLRQGLDTNSHLQSVTYAGIGRTSLPDNNNPIERPAIFILNQEFYNQINKWWQYSLALSYRQQNEYSEKVPYHDKDPALRQEARIYSRLSNSHKTGSVKWTNTFRQELRYFFTSGGLPLDEEVQFRSRLRSQVAVDLDKKKIHKVVISAEALFAISKSGLSEKKWKNFGYKESRFCAFYSVSPPESPLVFDFGYMNNLVGRSDAYDVHYLAMDVIWENPFGNPKHIFKRPLEYFE